MISMVRSMVFASGLLLTFWGDAAEYATYILDRSPIQVNECGISPIEMLTKKRPVLSDIVAFGSPCIIHRMNSNKSLGAREKPAIFIGKDDEMKGYRVFIPIERIVVVTQHVKNVKNLTDVQVRDINKMLHVTNGQQEHGDKNVTSNTKPRLSGWTRDPHMTRETH